MSPQAFHDHLSSSPAPAAAWGALMRCFWPRSEPRCWSTTPASRSTAGAAAPVPPKRPSFDSSRGRGGGRRFSRRGDRSGSPGHGRGGGLKTRAAWEIFRRQAYGRVVFTTSASALYGNFGQSNYAAAKLGLLGLMHSLKEEGARFGVKLNAVAPMARSRMTETILPGEVLEKLDPAQVSPAVAYLASEACAVNGQCWVVGAGSI